MNKTYTFWNDPGHGWIEVSLHDLKKLGIEKRISGFSFISADGKRVFLEEDCDGSYFMFHAEKAGWNVTFKDKHVGRFGERRPYYPFGTDYNYEANAKEMYA